MIDHRYEINAWTGIRTHDKYYTGAVLYKLTIKPTGSRPHCELVRYQWKENQKSEYMKGHIS